MEKTIRDNFVCSIADQYNKQIEELVEGKEKYKSEYYNKLIVSKTHSLLYELDTYYNPNRMRGGIVPGFGTKAGETTLEKLGWVILEKSVDLSFYRITEQGKEILDTYKKFA